MFDYDTHTRHMAELELSVQTARRDSAALPKIPMRVISILAVLVLTGAVLGSALA